MQKVRVDPAPDTFFLEKLYLGIYSKLQKEKGNPALNTLFLKKQVKDIFGDGRTPN